MLAVLFHRKGSFVKLGQKYESAIDKSLCTRRFGLLFQGINTLFVVSFDDTFCLELVNYISHVIDRMLEKNKRKTYKKISVSSLPLGLVIKLLGSLFYVSQEPLLTGDHSF